MCEWTITDGQGNTQEDMTVFTSLASLTVCLQQVLKLAELRLECNIQTPCYVCMSRLLVFVVLLKATCVRQKYKGNAIFVSIATLLSRTLCSSTLYEYCPNLPYSRRSFLSNGCHSFSLWRDAAVMNLFNSLVVHPKLGMLAAAPTVLCSP